MVFMGLDQSYTSSGVVIIDQNGQVLVSEVFRSRQGESDFQRSWSLYSDILNLVQKYQVKYLTIEGLAFGKFGNATRSLAILQGVLITNLQYLKGETYDSGLEKIEVITPSALKKFATGNGRADKKLMISHVPSYLLSEWRTKFAGKSIDDLADAYFLARKCQTIFSIINQETKSKSTKTLLILRQKKSANPILI